MSYNRFDYSRGMIRGQGTLLGFPVSLSGRIYKVDITYESVKLGANTAPQTVTLSYDIL